VVDLTGAKAKLGRAKFHTEAAKTILSAYVAGGFYRTVAEEDRKGRLLVKAINLQQLQPHFALAVGDAAHNFRSSLR